MEAPDRPPASPIVVVRRIDAAIVVEAQAERILAIRGYRPIATVASNKAQGPIAGVAITGRRIPNRTGRT